MSSPCHDIQLSEIHFSRLVISPSANVEIMPALCLQWALLWALAKQSEEQPEPWTIRQQQGFPQWVVLFAVYRHKIQAQAHIIAHITSICLVSSLDPELSGNNRAFPLPLGSPAWVLLFAVVGQKDSMGPKIEQYVFNLLLFLGEPCPIRQQHGLPPRVPVSTS